MSDGNALPPCPLLEELFFGSCPHVDLMLVDRAAVKCDPCFRRHNASISLWIRPAHFGDVYTQEPGMLAKRYRNKKRRWPTGYPVPQKTHKPTA